MVAKAKHPSKAKPAAGAERQPTLKQLQRQLHSVTHWYFLAATVLFGALALFALRQNNLTALNLRDRVLAVDKANGNVELALHELREFTYRHMNANLASGTGIYPPIQLKYRYERLVKAEKARTSKANKQIYHQAQLYCEQQNHVDFSGRNRVPCIRQYVSSHGASSEQAIPDALYKFDFVSPRWSPDLAGLSLLLAAASLLLFVVRFAMDRWLRSQVRG